MTRVDTRYL